MRLANVSFAILVAMLVLPVLVGISGLPISASIDEYSPARLAQESIPVTWHHDCSNTTGWLLDPDPSQLMNTAYSPRDDVEILSDGSALHSSAILGPGPGEQYHGSTFFYDLETPLRLEDLDLQVTLRHNGTPSRMGMVRVGLCDEHKNETFFIQALDGWYSDYIWLYKGYRNASGGATYHRWDGSLSGPWDGTFRVWHDASNSQLMYEDPFGSDILLPEDKIELLREIHHVEVVFFTKEEWAYESEQLLDIVVSGWTVTPDTTTTKTTTTTTTTTTTPTGGFLDIFEMFGNLGLIVTFGSLVVVIIFGAAICRSRGG